MGLQPDGLPDKRVGGVWGGDLLADVHGIEIHGRYFKNNIHVKLQSVNNGNKTEWSLTWTGLYSSVNLTLHSYHDNSRIVMQISQEGKYRKEENSWKICSFCCSNIIQEITQCRAMDIAVVKLNFRFHLFVPSWLKRGLSWQLSCIWSCW